MTLIQGLKTKLRGTIVHDLYRQLLPQAWFHRFRRMKDLARIVHQPAFLPLHTKLWRHLRDQRRKWPHYRYDFGYFYQGYDRIRVSGVRPTEFRFHQYGLGDLIREDMDVLDVGANVGFLAIEVARRARFVDAVELNPYLVDIGNTVAEWLGVRNIRFHACDFLAFQPERSYDVIMSFANHFTDDGNMRPSLRPYLDRLWGHLRQNGKLLFESHSADVADERFHGTMDSLDENFTRERREFLKNGVRLGGDRYFYVLRKK